MRLGFSLKVILLIQVALCFALGSALVLFTLKMQGLVGDIVASRFMVVSGGVAHEVEQALALGLGLGELRSVDGILRRETAREPAITGLTLFSETGAVVASEGKAALSGAVPEAWLRQLRRDAGSAGRHGALRPIRLVEGDRQIILAGLRNAYGELGGGVALTSSLATVYGQIRATYPRIALGGLVCLLAGLAATFAVVWLALRPTRRALAQAASWLDGLGAAGAMADPVPEDAARLLPGLEGFGVQIAEGHRLLDEAAAVPGGGGGLS